MFSIMKNILLAILVTVAAHAVLFAAFAMPRMNAAPSIHVKRASTAPSAMIADSHHAVKVKGAPKQVKKHASAKPAKHLVCGNPHALDMSKPLDRSHFTNPENSSMSANQTVRVCEYR